MRGVGFGADGQPITDARPAVPVGTNVEPGTIIEVHVNVTRLAQTLDHVDDTFEADLPVRGFEHVLGPDAERHLFAWLRVTGLDMNTHLLTVSMI